MDLVYLFGWLAMRLGAVVLARFAARLFRFGLGRPLGEGRGLTFARTALFFEQPCQTFDLRAEFGDIAFEADTVKAWCYDHTFTLAGGGFFSCASLPRKCVDFDGAEPRR